MHATIRPLLVGAAALAVAAPALAQWSTDPANNLHVADAPGGKDLSKVVPTADGGVYVSWLDNFRVTYKRDTWIWNGTAWSRKNILDVGPPARAFHSMCATSTAGVPMIYGGFDGTGVRNDVWIFDGTNWAAAGNGPPARQKAMMAFDIQRNRVVLFGGEDGAGNPLNDTWTWDGTTWTQQNPVLSPSARRGGAMAYSNQLSTVILFGGETAGGAAADTWQWDGTGWFQLVTNAPPARTGASMAFDQGVGNLVMFGGEDGGVTLNDTWRFNGLAWTQLNPNVSPSARSWAAMAEAPPTGGLPRCLLATGWTGSFNTNSVMEWNINNPPDLWSTRASGPSQRRGSTMCFDFTRNQVVLFGGLEQFGYDVMLQRLDADGFEQWPHGGVMVADRSTSSTIEYSLITDADGNAIVVFSDDRFLTGKVTAQKVNPAGVPQWNGPLGVQVGEGGITSSAAKAALLSSGEIVIAWNTTTAPTGVNMVRVDGAGVVTGPFVQADTLSPVRPLQASDVVSDGAGGWIALFVRCGGSNCPTSAKHLYVQRYNALGNPQWGVAPIAVFTTGSLQVNALPRLIPDGAGGGVFAWYDANNARQAFLQHILNNGTLKFSPTLNSADAEATRYRIAAAPAYDASSGEYFLATVVSPTSTVGDSVAAQKFDSAGNRLWGTMGVVVVTTGGQVPSLLNCVSIGGGACVAGWLESTSPTTHIARAALVDSAGTVPWTTTFNSAGGSKGRLNSTRSTDGFTVFSLTEGESTAVQNLNDDGTLGTPPGPTPCNAADIATAGNPDPNAGPDGFLTGDDFDLFVNAFFNELQRPNGSLIADLVDGDGNPPPDGFLTGSDFDYFLAKFFQGC